MPALHRQSLVKGKWFGTQMGFRTNDYPGNSGTRIGYFFNKILVIFSSWLSGRKIPVLYVEPT